MVRVFGKSKQDTGIRGESTPSHEGQTEIITALFRPFSLFCERDALWSVKREGSQEKPIAAETRQSGPLNGKEPLLTLLLSFVTWSKIRLPIASVDLANPEKINLSFYSKDFIMNNNIII